MLKHRKSRIREGASDKRDSYTQWRDSRLKTDELRLCELNRLFKAYHKRSKTHPLEADSDEYGFFQEVEAQIKSIQSHIEDVDNYDLYTHEDDWRGFYQCESPAPSDGPLWIHLKYADPSPYGDNDAATIANNRVWNEEYGDRIGVDGVYVRIQDLTENLAQAVSGLISEDGWYEWAEDEARYEVEQEQQEESLRCYVLSDFEDEIKKKFDAAEYEVMEVAGDEIDEGDAKGYAIAQLLNGWSSEQWTEYFYELMERSEVYWEESDPGCWGVDLEKMTASAEESDFDLEDYLFTS